MSCYLLWLVDGVDAVNLRVLWLLLVIEPVAVSAGFSGLPSTLSLNCFEGGFGESGSRNFFVDLAAL